MSDEPEYTEPEEVQETTDPAESEIETTEEQSVGIDEPAPAEDEIADESAAEVDPKPAAKKKPAASKKKPAAKKRSPGEAASDDERSEAGAKPAPEAKPVPTRRRDRQSDEQVIVRAHARYVRSSARKARLVCDGIRGKSVPEARAILQFSPRQVAEAWTKLLDSAVANAENNNDLDGDDLIILSITADEGPTLKRFQPRAMGRATKIRKRTSHLSIQLTPKKGG